MVAIVVTYQKIPSYLTESPTHRSSVMREYALELLYIQHPNQQFYTASTDPSVITLPLLS